MVGNFVENGLVRNKVYCIFKKFSYSCIIGQAACARCLWPFAEGCQPSMSVTQSKESVESFESISEKIIFRLRLPYLFWQ